MKTIVVLSGGLDSTTVLYNLLDRKHEVKAISFDYGQRHKKELDYAKQTTDKLGIEHEVIDMAFMKKYISNPALTGDIEVPEGHYEDENMKQTVVPNRNMIMASIAIGYAVNIDYDGVALGVHLGDHEVYPDCRPEFIYALKVIALVSNYKKIRIITPYLYVCKDGIVKDGIRLKADYSKTWTCYKGGDLACGKCGSCQERLEAFNDNNIKDPIEYDK